MMPTRTRGTPTQMKRKKAMPITDRATPNTKERAPVVSSAMACPDPCGTEVNTTKVLPRPGVAVDRLSIVGLRIPRIACDHVHRPSFQTSYRSQAGTEGTCLPLSVRILHQNAGCPRGGQNV